MISLPSGCMGIPPKLVGGPCAVGVDIRPDSWDVICADVLRSAMGTVVRPVFVGKVLDEGQVLSVMKAYKVRFGVSDSRPETTLAKRLQVAATKLGIRMWRAEYNTAPSNLEIQENSKEGILKLDRTLTMDAVQYAFNVGIGIILPQNFRELTRGQFVRELCNSTRVPTKWMGKDCHQWQESGEDHAFHALNYLMIAVRKGGLAMAWSEATAGPSLGIVEGSLEENMLTKVNKKTNEVEIDWAAVLDGDDCMLEA